MIGQQIVVAVTLLVFAAATASSAQQILVTVYYEALCPDSQAFITNQLYPVMQSPLAQRTKMEMVPFGKSNFSSYGSDVIFTCHHGPNECYANKVQSCAIEHIQVDSFQNTDTRDSKTLDYITCLMKAGNNFADSVYPGKKCSSELKLRNWDNIENCSNSTEGSNLLQHNGERTLSLKPALTSVPTIVFQNQYDETAQKLALTDFRAALCKQISEPLPQECRSTSAAAPAQTTNAVTMLVGAIASLLATVSV